MSSLTPFRSLTDLHASRAAVLSSENVSMSIMRGTSGSIILSNALKAASLLPIMSIRACGTVPTGTVPVMSPPMREETASQPPMYAERSMTPDMAGCILLFPNANTVFHFAATLVRAAAVAMPVGWQSMPSMAVSISPNSV